MRLAGQIKGGFYPCPPKAVALALRMLKPPAEGVANVFDPCCGKGAALLQLTAGLAGPDGSRAKGYGVELEPGRSDEACLVPGIKVVGHCDFFQATIVPAHCMSFCWVNPPFDDELGGGQRVEYSFLQRCTQLMPRGGVVCLVCPYHVTGDRDVRNHLLGWYDDIVIVPFPEDCRAYGEALVLGRRKADAVEPSSRYWDTDTQEIEPTTKNLPAFQPPPSGGPPRKFEKGGFTEDELLEAMEKSKLRELFNPPRPVTFPRPPLELSQGQMALVLAGGFLNTTLQKPGEPPILIKATPYKSRYLKETTEEVRGEGTDKEKSVTVNIYGERIMLKVRVAEASGEIHNVQ